MNGGTARCFLFLFFFASCIFFYCCCCVRVLLQRLATPRFEEIDFAVSLKDGCERPPRDLLAKQRLKMVQENKAAGPSAARGIGVEARSRKIIYPVLYPPSSLAKPFPRRAQNQRRNWRERGEQNGQAKRGFPFNFSSTAPSPPLAGPFVRARPPPSFERSLNRSISV